MPSRIQLIMSMRRMPQKFSSTQLCRDAAPGRHVHREQKARASRVCRDYAGHGLLVEGPRHHFTRTRKTTPDESTGRLESDIEEALRSFSKSSTTLLGYL